MKIFNIINDSNIGSLELSQVVRGHLIKAKNKIADLVLKIGQMKWDLKSRWFEPSKSILFNVVGKYDIPIDASNAFLKMIELSSLIPKSDFLNHFDNAALPGDFIRAVKWYCKKSNIKYDYRASSLLDSNKGSLCDRFGLLRSDPSKWLMTKDMNGDITIPINQDYIISVAKKFKPNLYTSDVGMPIINKFNEEGEHLQCNLSQSYIGLSILAIGGTMIVKCFSLTCPKNIALVNILIRCFKSLKIVKPITSKCDNSELYIVGIGFKGFDECEMDIRRIRGLMTQEPSLNESISPASLLQTLAILGENQVAKIEKNINWFHENIKPDYSEYCKGWVKMYLS